MNLIKKSEKKLRNVENFWGFKRRKFYRIRKIWSFMKKSVQIAIVIGIAVIIGGIGYQFSETTWNKVSVDEYYEKDGKVSHVVYPDNPQVLSVLQINKDKYILGENIFYVISNLQPMDQGTVVFLTPMDKIYYSIEFDGATKEFEKGYFRPQLSKLRDICEKEELVGEWTVFFKGYEQFTINFEVMNEILPGSEIHYQKCDTPTLVVPTDLEERMNESQIKLEP